MNFDIEAIRIPDAQRRRSTKPIANPCYVCGRDVRPDREVTVHLRTDLTLAPVEADVPSRDDQGWFVVGPDCARKIPSAYKIGPVR